MENNYDPTNQEWDKKSQQYLIKDLKQQVVGSKNKAKDNLSICKTCDKFDSKWRICNECGCQMDLKNIVYRLINKSPCPLDKW